MFTINKGNRFFTNNVVTVPGGSLLILFVKDNERAVRKQNARLFSKENPLENEVKTGSMFGPYICIWEKTDGKRVSKEVNSWPRDSQGRIINIGEENSFGHILIQIVESYSKDY